MDIELLAPIARLLNISLDTLLSFQEKLTGAEIEEIIREMDTMFSQEGYEKTYEWAMKIVEKYPNCNILIWQIAVMLDARRMTGGCKEPDQYDDQINSWYERALNDEKEEIRHHAADLLFGFYLTLSIGLCQTKVVGNLEKTTVYKWLCKNNLYIYLLQAPGLYILFGIIYPVIGSCTLLCYLVLFLFTIVVDVVLTLVYAFLKERIKK